VKITVKEIVNLCTKVALGLKFKRKSSFMCWIYHQKHSKTDYKLLNCWIYV